jgi:PEP-CTERM motif
VITQTGSGGFESDNHSFHVGTTGFNPHASVPEPGVVTGLLALGMAGVMKGRTKRRSNG